MGIIFHQSPSYAPERNHIVKRLVKEHWYRTCVLLLSIFLPHERWDEVLSHLNGLGNLLALSRVGDKISILLWDPNTVLHFCRFNSSKNRFVIHLYKSHFLQIFYMNRYSTRISHTDDVSFNFYPLQ